MLPATKGFLLALAILILQRISMSSSVSEGEKPAIRPRLLLIDGHAYIYRAFFAIRSLNSPDGRPTNAIYGFIKMLQKLRDSLKPTHLLVVWDGGLDPHE
jgi:5'-3' exonuclease